MTPLAISHTARVYDTVFKCLITRHAVSGPDVGAMTQSLRELYHLLGDEATEEFWRSSLYALRRIAMAMYSTPLPFNQLVEKLGTDWRRLQDTQSRSQFLYPQAADSMGRLLEQVNALLRLDHNPFHESLAELRSLKGSLCLIMRESRLNGAVQHFLGSKREFQGIRVVAPTQLRAAVLCDNIAVLGPCSWYPEYIFTAPRALSIDVFMYSWMRDNWEPTPVFLHRKTDAGHLGGHGVGMQPRVCSARNSHSAVSLSVDVRDLVPTSPSESVAAHMATTGGDDSLGSTLATGLFLAGDRAVFLDADEASTALVIDTSELGHVRVRRMTVDELEPGMYLLLRTSGGGDYVRPLADRIMGTKSLEARNEQQLWKQQLICAAKARHLYRNRRDLAWRVAQDLRKAGALRASAGNVFYWMSDYCIRTRSQEDFDAVMRYAGLGDRAEQLWRRMGFIDRAHRKAGHVIRKMLLKRIGEGSLETLERDGVMQFDLGNHNGASLTAYRITGRIQQQRELPISQLGIVLELGH